MVNSAPSLRECLGLGESVPEKILRREEHRLASVRLLLAELGEPHDVKMHGDEFEVSGSDAVGVSTARRLAFQMVRNEFAALSADLYLDESGVRYEVGTTKVFVPVYVDRGLDPVSFIIAPVDNQDFFRVFPVEFPTDIVAFHRYSSGTLSQSIRVLGQLVGVYCEAIRLAGNGVGLTGKLVRSLRLLTGELGDAVASARSTNAEHSSDEAGDSDSQGHSDSDPRRDKSGVHDSSLSVGAFGGMVCGDSEPTEGEARKGGDRAGGHAAAPCIEMVTDAGDRLPVEYVGPYSPYASLWRSLKTMPGEHAGAHPGYSLVRVGDRERPVRNDLLIVPAGGSVSHRHRSGFSHFVSQK